jgi:hypothetical protein
MGAGKTTVVSPLLSLCLADGDRLVTQVMPTNLLEQSRNVLRRAFSSPVMPKRIYTFAFSRGVEDDSNVVRQVSGPDLCWPKTFVMLFFGVTLIIAVDPWLHV